MNKIQPTYHLGSRITITSRKPTLAGKTGVVTGIFCAGQPDREHYMVHLDCDHDPARVYHVFPEDVEQAIMGAIGAPENVEQARTEL